MLVSVTERTREIGLRMAVGATEQDIKRQFLTEAVVLSVLGGSIGIGLGMSISIAVSRMMGWGSAVSPIAVIVAVAFSALGGWNIFWLLSRSQGRHNSDPIEALHAMNKFLRTLRLVIALVAGVSLAMSAYGQDKKTAAGEERFLLSRRSIRQKSQNYCSSIPPK